MYDHGNNSCQGAGTMHRAKQLTQQAAKTSDPTKRERLLSEGLDLLVETRVQSPPGNLDSIEFEDGEPDSELANGHGGTELSEAAVARIPFRRSETARRIPTLSSEDAERFHITATEPKNAAIALESAVIVEPDDQPLSLDGTESLATTENLEISEIGSTSTNDLLEPAELILSVEETHEGTPARRKPRKLEIKPKKKKKKPRKLEVRSVKETP